MCRGCCRNAQSARSACCSAGNHTDSSIDPFTLCDPWAADAPKECGEPVLGDLPDLLLPAAPRPPWLPLPPLRRILLHVRRDGETEVVASAALERNVCGWSLGLPSSQEDYAAHIFVERAVLLSFPHGSASQADWFARENRIAILGEEMQVRRMWREIAAAVADTVWDPIEDEFFPWVQRHA
mmetsp:Transcript_89769/g.267805  ORF Transcript_89769/g.267805 Transcript_89769/m.267805 type:complete len:182 (+) Transcript_89769:266-811(+)